ncbi:MAG: CARDB domain-containing protein, partial [Gallionellaceae bacterium]
SITGTCASSPCTVSGLTNGTSYTFTVHATNAKGNSAESGSSNAVTPATVPGAPTIGTATAGNGSASVAFTAPASNGGSAITGYTATSTPGSITGTCASSPCTVSGLTNGTSYTFTVHATNAVGNSAESGSSNAVTPKASQTISFGSAPSVVVDGTGTMNATATSSYTITFTSQTPDVCTVSGYTVTGVSVGTCTIAADQAGDATYSAAPEVTQSFSIGKGDQTIVFEPAPNVDVNGTGTVSATASSGLPVTFTSQTTSICTVSGSTVTGVNAGTCIIAADQGGDANYNPATQVTQTFSIGMDNQTISFGSAPSGVVVDGIGTVNATATSELAVSFTSLTPDVCTVSDNIVTGVSVGTCTIAADQAGDANYNPAPEVTQDFSVGMGNQTISFGGAPNVVVTGTGTVSATATSGLAVSFTSQTTSICTVSGSTVTGVNAGTCTIAADQGGDANYYAATQVTLSFSVGMDNQTISFGSAPSVVVDGTGALNATATSGLAVSFSSLTETVCTVSGSTVTGVSVGTCTVAADQAGDANYDAATEVTQSFSIGLGSQTISFDAAPSVVVGGTGTVSASGGNSGNPVTFTSTTADVCTVNGSTVTGVSAGTCTIAADQAGSANYNAATEVMQSFSVGLTSQTISFGTAPTVVVGGTGTVSATATSGLPVSFAITTTGVCTISDNIVTGVSAGTCTITADQAGDDTYSPAPQVTQSFSVGTASQTIIFGGAPTVVVGGTGSVSATGGASGNPVSFASTTLSICTVNGSTVTGVSAGTCTIAANQAGNANYNPAAQATQNITVGPANQTISFGAAPTVAVGGTGTVSATGGASGNPVTFTSATTSVCTTGGTNGSTVTGLTAGTCTISADQAGNANYNAATQVQQSFGIGMGSQTISFGTAPSVVVGGSGTASASATSGLAVTYSTASTDCSVDANSGVITGINAGTNNCVVKADQSGNANYSAAPQTSQTLSIGKASQGISFGTAPTVVVGGTGTMNTTATSSYTVSFSSQTTGVCTVSGYTVTGVSVGTCTIAADQAGDANYYAAPQVTQSFNVGMGNQAIVFNPAPNVDVGSMGTVSATGGNSVNPVTFASTTTDVCTTSGTNGSTVTGVNVGTCTIAADQAGDVNYNPAPEQTQQFSIGMGSQTITFGDAPTAVVVGGTGTVSASASSGLPVSFTSQITGVCTVSDNIVTGASVGTCAIAADQAGDANYNPALEQTQTFSVGMGNQTIGFNSVPNVLVGGTGTVSATATSGLVVSYSSLTTGICTVSGSTVTGVNVGTCTIAADQSGDANYNAAPEVTQNFSVGMGSQTIAFDPAPTVVVDGTGIVSAAATSGLTVSFSSLTPSVCTLSGNTVTGVSVGTCTIAADQGGDADYDPATEVTQSFTIGKGDQAIGFNPAPNVVVGGTGTVSALATSGLAVSFSSLTTGVCTVSGTYGQSVAGVSAGTCTIAANQGGDADFNAAPQVTLGFSVGMANQTISFGSAPTGVIVNGTGTVSATATSELAVSFSSLTPYVCTVSGNSVIGVSVGTCIIAADQGGNANYNPATEVTQSFSVGPASQTLAYSAEAGYGTAGVNPNSGTTSTSFTFKVVYTNAANTAPSFVDVCIDALPCSPMSVDASATATLNDGDYTNGEQYVYTTILAAGAHTYYFTAFDGTDGIDLPALGSLSGPTVNSIILYLPGGEVAQLVEPTGQTFTSQPTASPTVPTVSGVGFPNGTINYTVTSPVGGSVTTTLKFTPVLSPSATLYKVDNAGNATLIPASNWTRTDSGNTTTIALTLQDGGPFDLDGTANGQVVDPIAIAVPNNVDLLVSALSSPSLGGTVLAGSSITINDTVANGGTTPTTYPGGIMVNYYLGGTLIGNRTIASLAGGATSSATSTFTLPASFTPGSYQLSATVDPNNYQPETNENNNTTVATGTVTVTADVDLVPTSLGTTTTSLAAGGNLTVTDTVANQGTSPTSASSFRVNYYLSTDATITAADTLLGGRNITSIAAGATNTASTLVSVPAGLAPGVYYLGEIVDSGNAQPETNKANNALATVTITVTAAGGVDLVPTSISAGTSSVPVGGNFTVTDTVANQGISATSASSFRVNYYLSTDTTITAADTLIGGRNISSIAAGATNTASTLVGIPAGLAPGVYYVGEIVDSGNAQPETNKANNTLATVGTITVTALVGGVDLLPTSLNTTATSVYTGGSITINDTVMNQGSTAASGGGFLVNYYLSTNTIPLDGTLIGNRTITSLAAGATNSASSTFVLPATFAPGVYYVGIIVNKTQSQVETNYANDAMATVGTVTVVRSVDLVPTSLSTTATSVSRGGSFTVTDTVANQGASPTSAPGGFRVNYYLSTDTTITAADTLIGGRNIASIAAGGSNTASTSVNVPAGLAPGVYYVGEIVDSGNAQPETNKTNNTATTVGTITVN